MIKALKNYGCLKVKYLQYLRKEPEGSLYPLAVQDRINFEEYYIKVEE